MLDCVGQFAVHAGELVCRYLVNLEANVLWEGGSMIFQSKKRCFPLKQVFSHNGYCGDF